MFNFSFKKVCLQISCTKFIGNVVNAVNIRAYQLIKYEYFMKYLLQIYFNTSFFLNQITCAGVKRSQFWRRYLEERDVTRFEGIK